MPTDLAEDSLDLTIDLLEAVTPNPGDSSLPFPGLKATGRVEVRAFRTVVLENPYLRVVVVPDLGGRILQIFDKRTATDILPYSNRLTVQGDSLRGASADAGIQFTATGYDRLNALGTVSTMPDYVEEEDDPSGVWLGEICGDGIGAQVRISLPPERAEVSIECRFLNRTFAPIAVNPGLRLGLGDGQLQWHGNAALWQGEQTSLRLTSTALFDELRQDGHQVAFLRFQNPAILAPRQLDSWTVTLTPFSIGDLSGASNEAGTFFDDAILRVQSVEQRLGHKLVILTESGQTLESPADLYPENILEIPLDGLPSRVKAFAILDPGKTEILRIDGETAARPAAATYSTPETPFPDPSWSETRLRAATFHVAHRHLAHLLLGYRCLGEKKYEEANREFEQALLFNAEDHLTWWAKAAAQRFLGTEANEQTELLNAHYLAPLEPALRAESYLVNVSQTKEPSAVLRPLEESPEAFVEVACLLLEASLLEEAVKWIDEALRHVDLPMLRYLLAFAYLSGSRMGVEAADQVARASQRGLLPPYAYRAIEKRALAALVEKFPEDEVLRGYFRLTV